MPLNGSCAALVAAGVGDASSPRLVGKPYVMTVVSRDKGVALTFCDGASQPPVSAGNQAEQQGSRGAFLPEPVFN